jgi:hypothetical protein
MPLRGGAINLRSSRPTKYRFDSKCSGELGRLLGPSKEKVVMGDRDKGENILKIGLTENVLTEGRSKDSRVGKLRTVQEINL